MKELTVDATIENIAVVTDFVNEQLDRINCPMETRFDIDVAIDELFGNIARYAYGTGAGKATVRFETVDHPSAVMITFTDSGTPFNPLDSADPDIDRYMEERRVGGLGIFFVKNMMDQMEYRYLDGQNILTIKKELGDH